MRASRWLVTIVRFSELAADQRACVRACVCVCVCLTNGVGASIQRAYNTNPSSPVATAREQFCHKLNNWLDEIQSSLTSCKIKLNFSVTVTSKLFVVGVGSTAELSSLSLDPGTTPYSLPRSLLTDYLEHKLFEDSAPPPPLPAPPFPARKTQIQVFVARSERTLLRSLKSRVGHSQRAGICRRNKSSAVVWDGTTS